MQKEIEENMSLARRRAPLKRRLSKGEKKKRDGKIVELRAKHKLPLKVIAAQFGLNVTQVSRVLKEVKRKGGQDENRV